jgi:secondary thiamine-phosphate synthase enzyme
MLDIGMRWVHRTVDVTTARRLDIIDLTSELPAAVDEAGITQGCVMAFCAHTTATLVLNEFEDGALEDLRRRLDQLVPAETYYAHDDLERRRHNLEDGHERPNGSAHVAQMLLGGSSHVIPVIGGKPALGRWQRLMLVELDESRERRVVISASGI